MVALNNSADGSHPENASEVFVDLPGPMTLSAAGEELSHMGLLYASKDELIAPAATAGTSLPVHISTNGSDFSLLLEHGLPSRRQVTLVVPHLVRVAGV